MNTRQGLEPIFCGICGERIGWVYDDTDVSEALFECDECAEVKTK